MAGKRISQNAINWHDLALKVPKAQRDKYMDFKAKSDGYLSRVTSNPEAPPKIIWELYKSKVPIPGMVDEFQKAYESLTIPYPVDNYTKLVEEQEKQVRAEIDSFSKESKDRITGYQNTLTHLKSLLPFDQMSMEEFMDSYPDDALDSIQKPTYWPHDEEEQKDWRDKGHPLYGQTPHGDDH